MKSNFIVGIALAMCLSTYAQENRSFDGSHNNLVHTHWGQAGSQFRNFLTPTYADGISEPTGKDRPNPREISNRIFGQDNFLPSNLFLTDFAWSFGQFLDHDITFNDDNFDEFIPIEVPECDAVFDPDCTASVEIPMRRSKSVSSSGTSPQNPRRHINDITHWIDGSGVYGSEDERAEWLRTFKGGKLKTSEGGFLPFNTVDGNLFSEVDEHAPFMLLEGEPPVRHFIAGDIRANEQPSLASLHTLFVREHNRLCDEVFLEHPAWSDEQIYQHVRKLVGGLIQSIVYEEWLPSLGIKIDEYKGYDPYVDPSIMNVFSAAAFRLGHSLVNEQIMRIDEYGDSISYGSIHLKDAFFNPLIITEEGGIAPVFRGMASQMQQTFDTKIVNTLRNFLFGPPGAGGLDLVSLNLQRGRERGLPDYNSIREAFGLPRKTDFWEISSNPDLATTLKQVYDNDINNIDPWAGMLSEDIMDGAAVGELIMTILKRQFENLRDGDRYYYESDYALSEEDKKWIKETTFADIIKRNSKVENIQKNVFLMDGHDFVGVEMGGFENIRAVNLEAYPNPVAKYFTLKVYSLKSELATFSIKDLSGKVFFEQEVHIQSGNNQFEFELEDIYTSGVYVIYLESEESRGMLKIVKK